MIACVLEEPAAVIIAVVAVAALLPHWRRVPEADAVALAAGAGLLAFSRPDEASSAVQLVLQALGR